MDRSLSFSAGVLALVVGPSGAGKDALMSAARMSHAHDTSIVFPRRVITRAAMPGAEDHDSLTPDAFAAAEARGGFALSWRAHGLAYGIPAAIFDDLAAGRLVVVNVSRGVIAIAEGFGCRVTVLNVTATPEVLAARIARRGRESAGEIALRLKREVPVAVTTARLVEVRNDGSLAEGEAAFLAALAAARK